ncbi:MAG TPA: DUF3558 domain-containing protein [Pseudonocardiaceae bacterium]|jgi:hypothetical protein|nr:DUF3558 domain-containing protein [Pseudonocardiaceae bacterium]
MRIRTGLLLAGLVSVVALTACTGNSGAAPKPSSPPTATTVPTMVDDPIDLSRIAAKPCTMLRPDQLAQFHIVTPGTTGTNPISTGAAGVTCAWQPVQNTEPTYQAGVDLHSGGLPALYRRRSSLPVFQPFSESGYPGVDTATSASVLAHGRCTVQIEVAAGVLLDASVTVRDTQAADYPDPCSDAQSFAAATIANSQGQQP